MRPGTLATLRVIAESRRARRDHADKAWLRTATQSDRDARSRMDGLVFAVFLAFVVVPASVLITDYVVGAGYVVELIVALRGE